MTRSRDLANLADSTEFTSADNTKLDGIEASATADQTNAEIKTAVEAGSDIALGGNPTTTTQSQGNNSTRLATTAYTDVAIAALADSAPSTLNTLNELAAALGDDAAFSTTVTNSIATKLPLAGGAVTGNVTFGDNDKAIFGAGSDLQIYHDATNSYIDSNTGRLYVTAASSIRLTNSDNTENYARFNEDGSVQLYHNNEERLATTATGIDVTGTVSAALVDIDATSQGNFTEAMRISNTGGGANEGNYIQFEVSNTNGYGPRIGGRREGSGGSGLHFYTGEGNAVPTEKVRIDHDGNVGIGTASPARTLSVESTGNRIATLKHTDGTFAFATFSDTNTSDDGQVRIGALTNDLLAFAGGTERMRIDSSGNLGIATTENVSATSSGQGLWYQADGWLAVSRAGNTVAYFNRLTNDGDIVQFRKNGTTVGSIGALGSAGVYIAAPTSGGSALVFNDNAPILYPAKNNSGTIAVADNVIDLGASGVRFKDLYLSGGVYLGGTGAANKLEDYETGTFAVTLTWSTPGNSSVSYIARTAQYVKVGRMVTFQLQNQLNIVTKGTASGNLTIAGFPFAFLNTGGYGHSGLIPFTTNLPITSGHTLICAGDSNVTTARLFTMQSNGAFVNSQDPSNYAQINISGTYMTT